MLNSKLKNGFIHCVVTSMFIITSCKKDLNNTMADYDNSFIITDSLIYDLSLTIKDENIIKVEKYFENNLIQTIMLNYIDTIVEKYFYSYDTLERKSIYYLNTENYAKYSIDSFYNDSIFINTSYKYDLNGYLTEEMYEPGIFCQTINSIYFNDIRTDTNLNYSKYNYHEYNGNIYADEFIFGGSMSTNLKVYYYSDLPMKYDILTFMNTIIGKQNLNLPNSFGSFYYGKPPTYYEDIKFEYVLYFDLVVQRTDYIRAGGRNRKKIINNFHYLYK